MQPCCTSVGCAVRANTTHPGCWEAVTRCPHGQDLQAMLGQRAGSQPGPWHAGLWTAHVLWRSCYRSSSEAPTSMAAPSWITARCLMCCQPTAARSHSRPLLLGFLFQQPHGDQRIPFPSSLLTHRACFKVSSSSLACPSSQTDDLSGYFETHQEMALPSLLGSLLSGLQELSDGRGGSSLSFSRGTCSVVMLLSICRSMD